LTADDQDSAQVLAAEDMFFQALLTSDGVRLDAVVTPDFLLIDVLSGSEIARAVLVDLVGSGQLKFDTVERLDARVRLFGEAAVVTGQTRMRGRFGDQTFAAHSRYTHVYVRRGGAWQLASAQGTPIASV
jgi:ketosteroid isomerase-like protein